MNAGKEMAVNIGGEGVSTNVTVPMVGKIVAVTVKVGDKVAVDMSLSGMNFFLDGGIVRIDEEGAGIAFRDVEPATVKALRLALEKIG